MKRLSVKDLTAEEKLRLICSDGFWHTPILAENFPAYAFRTDLSGSERNSDMMTEGLRRSNRSPIPRCRVLQIPGAGSAPV